MLSTSTGLNIEKYHPFLSKKPVCESIVLINLKTRFEKLKREKNGGHYGDALTKNNQDEAIPWRTRSVKLAKKSDKRATQSGLH